MGVEVIADDEEDIEGSLFLGGYRHEKEAQKREHNWRTKHGSGSSRRKEDHDMAEPVARRSLHRPDPEEESAIRDDIEVLIVADLHGFRPVAFVTGVMDQGVGAGFGASIHPSDGRPLG